VFMPDISVLKEFPAVQYSQLDNHILVINETAAASDMLLKRLLDSGCSIIEVTERGRGV
jgi:ABC-2 type transport system ATP-binding protein